MRVGQVLLLLAVAVSDVAELHVKAMGKCKDDKRLENSCKIVTERMCDDDRVEEACCKTCSKF
eukprot:CAMPEP_0204276424 /NCGR_PEP_ID=MMETSP0468-20130131/28097_1 /ASSEMBLY_ACC=CAM_ASM_000383 /TAXON_ID=2969 /ORGANISM="Oxyrrhis marina" /LENGTH=62 /DNA_ID=CAMNT_0051253021 /DNA_START=66 /DNA_END=254 /DNA_ORIENTATION=-